MADRNPLLCRKYSWTTKCKEHPVHRLIPLDHFIATFKDFIKFNQ
jgi:hypothetical protein